MYSGNRGSNDLSDLVGGFEDDVGINNNTNKSYSSSPSSSNASSSKAVLAALRALQDKIRRLETERSQALDEAAQLKHQLKNQEIDAEHIKQRESLASQKSLQEARNAYERLLNDKTELEIRFSRLEEKNKLNNSSSEELHKKILMLEEEKQNGLIRFKDLELQQQQIETRIQQAEQKEKDLAHTLIWETKRHEEEIDSQRKRLQKLHDELNAAVQEKGANEAKLLELDQLVAQLLSVNEALVAQLTGKPVAKKASGSGKVVRKKKASSSTSIAKKTGNLPRAASVSTVNFDASKTTKFDQKKGEFNRAVNQTNLDHLENLHNMYVNLAKGVKDDKKKKTKKSTGVNETSQSSATPIITTRARSYSDSVASVRSEDKPVTRISRKKSEIEKASSSTGKTEPSSSNKVSNKISGIRIPTTSVASSSSSFEYLLQESSDDDDNKLPKPPSQNQYNRSNSSSSSSSSSSGGGGGADSSPPSFYSTLPPRAPKEELQNVISSLEDEFDTLNRQYRRLLSSVNYSVSPSSEAVHADELVNVIQKLHKKGEQLRSLKSPTK